MGFNLNQIFRFNIRNKLITAFLTLSTLPLVVSGLYAIHVHTHALEHSELEHLEHDVLTVCERTATFLNSITSDMRLLDQSRTFRYFLTHLNDKTAEQNLIRQLQDFAQSKRIYYQIRYIDNNGETRIDVRQNGEIYEGVQTENLQEGQSYLRLISDLLAGGIAIAPLELADQKNGNVAAISYALPVTAGGVLVADVFAKDLFYVIEGAHENTGGHVGLVSKEGYYLYHSDQKWSWNQRDKFNLFQTYPSEVSEIILSGQTGTLSEKDNVLAYAPLFPDSPQPAGNYTLFMSRPRSQVLAPVTQFEQAFYLLLGGFVILSIAAAYIAAAQFTRPINALQREAEVIAGGEYGRRLQVKTYDEIQRLADAFNTMAQAVIEREVRIEKHKNELEQIVTERTAELTEEKGKMQAILDNVPSAFVLLDSDLHILSVSRAFEDIFGHTPEKVLGQPYHLFFDQGLDVEPIQQAQQKDTISSRVQLIPLPNHTTPRHIERIVIPIQQEGQVDRLIEVLTDITDRKEMEARVIRSEKLATTGEMAAVIAHEIRNSLTSVKMILQLELERPELDPNDKEALEVATEAVQRMETVVSDLLKFARPSPPQFQSQSANDILRESLTLIQHQIQRKGIQLHTNLQDDLHPVQADADQLKEVFVNLLLNAAQTECDEINITTKAKSNTHIQIVIEDNGTGIALDVIERIFDPFFTTKTDGTGLGLSMAQRTVESHKGQISVENRSQSGAKFTVELPIE